MIFFVILGNTCGKAIHNHKCLRCCRAFKVLGNLTLIKPRQRIVVAKDHVSCLTVMSFRQAFHLNIFQAKLSVFRRAVVCIEITHAESFRRLVPGRIPHLSYLEHNPVIIQTCKLVVDRMDAVNDPPPFKETACRRAILIPQVRTVELILNTEEIKPFHSGKDRGVHDQVLIGLRVAGCKCIYILTEHNGSAACSINPLICQFPVCLPHGKVYQSARSVLLGIFIGEIDAGRA